jgi:hypothetical protein
MKASKVQPKSWHVAMAKLHDLLAWPTIDWANVILGVVVVHNEEGMFWRGHQHDDTDPLGCWILMSNHWCWTKLLLNGLGLINIDLDPCPYHILTSMGGSEKTQRLTKQEVVIRVNPNKPTNYTIVRAQTMVTHVTSYDMLVGGVVLYPLGVTIDFWEETAYYHLGW